jgi:multidrug efflux pump subunit AcrB
VSSRGIQVRLGDIADVQDTQKLRKVARVNQKKMPLFYKSLNNLMPTQLL